MHKSDSLTSSISFITIAALQSDLSNPVDELDLLVEMNRTLAYSSHNVSEERLSDQVKHKMTVAMHLP